MAQDVVKNTPKEVLKAALELESVKSGVGRSIQGWTAVTIYCHLHPNESRYRTVEFGITDAVQTLHKRHDIVQVARGVYKVNKDKKFKP